MTTCLFCRIIQGEIPAEIIYQDEKVLALNDIQPQAPVHKLIIPKQHIATINDLKPEDKLLIGHMVQTASTLAVQQNINQEGYRLVMNCNHNGGQTVFHIHLHLIGGRALQWPPG